MSFHVGQKVEHVRWNGPWYLRLLASSARNSGFTLGQVYTVSAVYDYGFGRKAIDLVERPWPSSRGEYCYPGWVAYHFRPIVESKRKTSIEVFKKLLVTSKQPMNVE